MKHNDGAEWIVALAMGILIISGVFLYLGPRPKPQPPKLEIKRVQPDSVEYALLKICPTINGEHIDLAEWKSDSTIHTGKLTQGEAISMLGNMVVKLQMENQYLKDTLKMVRKRYENIRPINN